MRNLLILVLARVTSRSLADSIVGDLEQVRRQRADRSTFALSLWYLCALLMITAHAGFARARARLDGITPRGLLGGASVDVRHTLRSLRHERWYAGAAVGVIALAIGLASTVFAVVDGILFKPLPYPSADRSFVVAPFFKGLDRGTGTPSVSARDLRDWHAAIPEVTFTGISSSRSLGGLALGQGVNEARYAWAAVDEQFFDVIGVRPLLGGFRPEHFVAPDARALPGAAIISFDVWQTRFGGDPNAVGRRVALDESRQWSIEIAGVMPRFFAFPGRVDAKVIVASAATPATVDNPRARRHDQILARVPAGLDPDVVRQRIEAAMPMTAAGFPAAPAGGWSASPHVRFSGPFDQATLVALRQYINKGQQAIALTVFVAAAALILLACVNVSGLMTARGHQRVRELVVRRALGANSLVIARLLFIESLLVASAGAAIGMLLSIPFLRFSLGLLPETLHPLKTPDVDWRVAVFGALAMFASAIAIGIWPVWKGVKLALGPAATDGAAATRRVKGFGRMIVGTEVAVGLVLTLAGALIVGSLIRVWTQEIGFDPDGLIAIQLRLPGEPSNGRAPEVDELLQRIRSVSAVASAGITDALILQHATWGGVFKVPPGVANPRTWVESHAVTSGFFDVMQPKLVEGRYPSPAELDAGGDAVVLGAFIARAYWPGETALGRQFEARGRTFNVVGVVEDARYSSWDNEPSRIIYGPYAPLAMSASPNLLIRVAPGPVSPVREVLHIIEQFGSRIRAVRVDPLDGLLADSIRPRRFQSLLFGSFAAAALVILGIGVLGLSAMTTMRRTREIGIRMALGATREGIIRLCLGEQFVGVTAGLLVGAAMATWAVSFLRASLYGLTTYDGYVWTTAVITVAATAGLGTLIVARQASRVDPVTALRVE